MAQLQPKNWNWWYDAILDWMMANPDKSLGECAKTLKVTQPWLSVVINSDMFQAALAQRKRAFSLQHDLGLIERTTRVATLGLDAMIAKLESKKDNLPLETLAPIVDGALKRLGYGVEPKGASVNVNVQNNGGIVAVPVSSADLEEARMALRRHQDSQRVNLPPTQESAMGLEGPPTLELEAAAVEEADTSGATEDEEDGVASLIS